MCANTPVQFSMGWGLVPACSSTLVVPGRWVRLWSHNATSEENIKRCFIYYRSTDFEDPKVVSKMCAIFQGSVVMPGSGQQVLFVIHV